MALLLPAAAPAAGAAAAAADARHGGGGSNGRARAALLGCRASEAVARSEALKQLLRGL